MRKLPDRFLVAISFSGEERALVEPLAEALERKLGEGTVFYDKWFEHYIAGHDADLRLQRVYVQQSELVVVGVSGSYGSKSWTRTEFEAVRALGQRLRASKDPRDAFRILPLRVGDGEVEGVHVNTIDLDIRLRPVEDTVALIVNRLGLACPERARGAAPQPELPPRSVFLAESTPDLDDPARPVSRHHVKSLLVSLGWRVLPADEYGDTDYDAALARDLQASDAYVQLIGPYPWKRGDYDRRQFNAAKALPGLRRFVFRSDAIDLAQVQSTAHRQWLESPGLIVSGFDDFLNYLERELATPKASRFGSDKNTTLPPLVRVAVRSANPEPLWEQVFQWIYLQHHMLSEQLAPGESFAAKHDSDPCHGFLIVCDAPAMEDGPLSPRRDMIECRQIQIGEKDAARRPPVALVYWPPPHASWARLLRSVPPRLRYAEAGDGTDVPKEIQAFFDDVRQVAA